MKNKLNKPKANQRNECDDQMLGEAKKKAFIITTTRIHECCAFKARKKIESKTRDIFSNDCGFAFLFDVSLLTLLSEN